MENKIPSPCKHNTHSLLRKELKLPAEAEGHVSKLGVRMEISGEHRWDELETWDGGGELSGVYGVDYS